MGIWTFLVAEVFEKGFLGDDTQDVFSINIEMCIKDWLGSCFYFF